MGRSHVVIYLIVVLSLFFLQGCKLPKGGLKTVDFSASPMHICMGEEVTIRWESYLKDYYKASCCIWKNGGYSKKKSCRSSDECTTIERGVETPGRCLDLYCSRCAPGNRINCRNVGEKGCLPEFEYTIGSVPPILGVELPTRERDPETVPGVRNLSPTRDSTFFLSGKVVDEQCKGLQKYSAFELAKVYVHRIGQSFSLPFEADYICRDGELLRRPFIAQDLMSPAIQLTRIRNESTGPIVVTARGSNISIAPGEEKSIYSLDIAAGNIWIDYAPGHFRPDPRVKCTKKGIVKNKPRTGIPVFLTFSCSGYQRGEWP